MKKSKFKLGQRVQIDPSYMHLEFAHLQDVIGYVKAINFSSITITGLHYEYTVDFDGDIRKFSEHQLSPIRMRIDDETKKAFRDFLNELVLTIVWLMMFVISGRSTFTLLDLPDVGTIGTTIILLICAIGSGIVIDVVKKIYAIHKILTNKLEEDESDDDSQTANSKSELEKNRAIKSLKEEL